MNTLYTLQQIKIEWENTCYSDYYEDLETFLALNYIPVYSTGLDFIGYSKGLPPHKVE